MRCTHTRDWETSTSAGSGPPGGKGRRPRRFIHTGVAQVHSGPPANHTSEGMARFPTFTPRPHPPARFLMDASALGYGAPNMARIASMATSSEGSARARTCSASQKTAPRPDRSPGSVNNVGGGGAGKNLQCLPEDGATAGQVTCKCEQCVSIVGRARTCSATQKTAQRPYRSPGSVNNM